MSLTRSVALLAPIIWLQWASCGGRESPRNYLEPESSGERQRYFLQQCKDSDQEFCVEIELLLDAVQQERHSKNLQPLVRVRELDAVALSWACAEENRLKIQHGDWHSRQAKAGFIPGGQNLLRLSGTGFDSERMRRAIALWRTSPSHYVQWVLPENRFFGAAVCVQNGSVVLAHEFVLRARP